jgi:uncharacterized protein (DUF433 family)
MLKPMQQLLERITHDPNVMGGRACVRGMRVTAGTILGQLASGTSFDQLLADYPYLELDDIRAVLAYAAWLADQRDLPLQAS